MNIDLTELKNNLCNKIDVDIIYSFNEDELSNTEIRRLDNVQIKGKIFKDVLDNICIDLIVDGEMILPCSVTLKDVPYPFHIKIDGSLDEILEEIEDFSKKIENSIDIFPIIWENILMEIPMKVVSEDAKDYKLEGNGWKLITDDDQMEINPELAKLKDLL